MIQLYILVPVLLFFLLHAKVETKFTLMLSCARVMRRCARRLRSREFFYMALCIGRIMLFMLFFSFFHVALCIGRMFFFIWRYVFVDLFLFFFFFHVALYVGRTNTVIIFVDVYFGDVRLFMWICL